MTKDENETLRKPTPQKVKELAKRLNITLNDDELADYTRLLQEALEDIEQIRGLRSPTFQIHDRKFSDRPSGYRPNEEEDPLNAWILKCEVGGADTGPLSGKTIGLKDNIALAGYEMTCGSRVLQSYVPQIDATVVTRLLEAGATIVGKNNMESFAWSGSSDISDFGTVPNPHNTDHLAGGSSSGAGAAVAEGDCDIALGGDQGGSIRIPASWCGIVGLKPTTGLVPYTGIFPLDPTIDHVGPMTRTVRDAAESLEVIGGEDLQDGIKMDARQPNGIETDLYVKSLGQGVEDISIGVLENGFDWDVADPGINETVREMIDNLEDRGAMTQSVSVDYHNQILSLLTPMEIQGGHRLVEEDGIGTHQTGWYWSGLIDAFGDFKDARANELPPTAKNSLIIGSYLREEYGIEFYAKAKNIILELKRQYDNLLSKYDVLVLPTVPIPPYKRDPSLTRVERLERIVQNHRNTAQFDHTHHPAMTVPCGSADGFPVGFQIVGSHFDERTLFQVADVVEELSGWEL